MNTGKLPKPDADFPKSGRPENQASNQVLDDTVLMPVVKDTPEKQVAGLQLDPNDPFEKILIEMVELNRAKRHDYAASDDPWQNFYDSAIQVNDTAGKSIETLIATKQARLRSLLFTEKGRQVRNESIRDTILDRAVYSVIGVSVYDRGDYFQKGTNNGS